MVESHMTNLKDSVVSLYVKKFIIPRALIFDKPGFVDFKISGKTTIFLRQLVVPETFFVLFEKKIVDEFGRKGEELLYSLGKIFGYSFAQNGRFENIKDHPGEKIIDWIKIANKFVEGTYASSITEKIDVNQKIIDYELKNFVVCRKLGYDHFFACGGAAGLIAWILQDKNIEGWLYGSKYDGGSHLCKVKCALPKTISKELGVEPFMETNLDGLDGDMQTYQAFNKETDISNKKSFQDYLNSKLFTYVNGIITYGQSERFFLMEVSGMYLLERGITNKRMKKIMFDSAFDTGQNLFGGWYGNDLSSVMDLLSALGWGEVMILKSGKGITVMIKHFPWTKYYKETKFLIIRGLLSGIFSKIYGKRVIFKDAKVSTSEGYLTLLFDSRGIK